MPPHIIDDPNNGGSDPGAWADAIKHGGIPVSDFDHLIHDADGDGSDSLATSGPDVLLPHTPEIDE